MITLMKLRFVGNTPLQLTSHQKTINVHCYRCVVLHFLLMKTPCIRVRYNPTIYCNVTYHETAADERHQFYYHLFFGCS